MTTSSTAAGRAIMRKQGTAGNRRPHAPATRRSFGPARPAEARRYGLTQQASAFVGASRLRSSPASLEDANAAAAARGSRCVAAQPQTAARPAATSASNVSGAAGS